MDNPAGLVREKLTANFSSYEEINPVGEDSVVAQEIVAGDYEVSRFHERSAAKSPGMGS